MVFWRFERADGRTPPLLVRILTEFPIILAKLKGYRSEKKGIKYDESNRERQNSKKDKD